MILPSPDEVEKGSTPEQAPRTEEPVEQLPELEASALEEIHDATEDLAANAERLPADATPDERAAVDQTLEEGEAAATTARLELSRTLGGLDDEDDELDDYEGAMVDVPDLVHIAGLPLKELHNYVQLVFQHDRNLDDYFTEDLASLKFTELRAIEKDNHLTSEIDRLLSCLQTGELDESVMDNLVNHLRMRHEHIQHAVKAVDQLLEEQARASVLAEEQAEKIKAGKFGIALKAGMYAAAGLTFSAIGAGVGGAIALTATRMIENTAAEVRRRDAIKAKVAELKQKITTDTGFREQLRRELSAALADKKQEQLDKQGRSLSDVEVTVNFARLAAPDAYADYVDAIESESDVTKLQHAFQELRNALEQAGQGEMLKQLLVHNSLERLQIQQREALEGQRPGLLDHAKRAYEVVMNGDGSLSERNITTLAFGMAALSARRMPVVRNVLGAFTGARLAIAIVKWKKGEWVHQDAAHGGPTAESLAAAAGQDIAVVGPALAQARQRLLEDKTLSPLQRNRLKDTVTQLENVLVRINKLTAEQAQLFSKEAQQAEQQRKGKTSWKATGAKLAGAAAGFFIPDMAHAASEHLFGVDPHMGVADEAQQMSRPATAADLQPNTSSAHPEANQIAGSAPAPASGAESTIASPVTPTATAEQLSHVVGKGEGLSHALKGQDSMRAITNELNDTKVQIGGKTVSLMETGVRNAGEVSATMHTENGQKVIELFDAHDGHKITGSELERYLYIVKEGPGADAASHLEHATGTDGRIEDDAVTIKQPGDATIAERSSVEFRAPLVTEDANAYIAAGLRDYVAHHPDYAHLATLPDEALAQRPELSNIVTGLRTNYTEQLGAETVGGGIETVETGTGSTTTELVNEQTHRLTEKGIQHLGLREHISPTGEPQHYENFKQDVLKLLAMDNRERITGPDGLIFEERGGQLYVDIVGSGKEHFLLDQKMYTALMEHIEDHPRGPIPKAEFYQILDDTHTVHPMQGFETDQYSLGRIDFATFKGQLHDIMTTHQIDRFKGPNGLTFIQEGDQLYVRAAINRYELTPELYQSIIKRYLLLAADETYQGVFDGEQLKKAVEAAK